MLRLIVLMLVLLNAVYFAWGQGWLQTLGVGPTVTSEPQRLKQQIRPQALVVIADSAMAQKRASEPAPGVGQCLQSSVLNETQASAVHKALVDGAWPSGSWTLDGVALPAQWIIYMGKYDSAAELKKKRAQLENMELTLHPLANAALEPGLSLGVFASEPEARAALELLAQRGVRTAKVLLNTPAPQQFRLRLPALDEALQKQLDPIKSALADSALVPCQVSAQP